MIICYILLLINAGTEQNFRLLIVEVRLVPYSRIHRRPTKLLKVL